MRVERRMIGLADLRRAGYCHRGVRRWCARHGIDWAEALKRGGVPVERVRGIDDAMARRLIKMVTEHG